MKERVGDKYIQTLNFELRIQLAKFLPNMII